MGESIYSLVNTNKIGQYQQEIISMLSEFANEEYENKEMDETLKDFKPFIQYVYDEGDGVDKDKLLGDCGMILSAATDTTATTLEFCIMLAIKYQDIQQRIYEELRDIIGDDGDDGIMLNISVYNRLNVLRAFVHECLRLYAPGNIGGIRHSDKEYVIDDGKYVIPKNSIIAINIAGINKDYRYWNGAKEGDDMEEMHLEYWLNDDGKFVKNEAFLTFAYGKRDCVGRNLAMRELLIILSHLFMRYEFKNGNGDGVEWDIKFKVDHLLKAVPMNVDVERS